MLVATMKEEGTQTAEMLGIVLTTLTHLSMHDQANVKFRLHGAHLVG
jgi:hypothetical protein